MTPLLYEKVFSNVQKSPMTPKPLYAMLAYILILLTIVYICIPLSKVYSHSWLAFGMVGLCIYGIYNTTNAAVFNKYPPNMVFMDTLWGFACFSVLGLMYSKD